MPQVKVYGLQENIAARRSTLSDAIHAALMEGIGTPESKRFQRFVVLEPANFIFPRDRTNNYTIIEISMFEGRSVAAKKNLIHLLYEKITSATDITLQNLEITIFETPQCNWGIRGIPGDELKLSYRVDV